MQQTGGMEYPASLTYTHTQTRQELILLEVDECAEETGMGTKNCFY